MKKNFLAILFIIMTSVSLVPQFTENHTPVFEGCEIDCPLIRLAVEHCKIDRGWKPLILTLNKINLFLWVDDQGRVREKKDDALHYPPLFLLNLKKKRLLFEEHSFPLDVYEQNNVRSRARFIEKNIPVLFEVGRPDHKVRVYIGGIRLPLQRISGEIQHIEGGGRELRLNGLSVHTHIRLFSRQPRTQGEGLTHSQKSVAGALRGSTPRVPRTISSQERSALIDLYKSTNGDDWTHNGGWKTQPLDNDGFARSGTENCWYGVFCNDQNPGVEKIELPDNNLRGPIPASIWRLSSLRCLKMSGNSITGAIPDNLPKLVNLGSLFLNGNQLTGTIPPDLGEMKNLVNLFLDSNQLTGDIPRALGNLTHLRSLRLGSNLLSGKIPEELGNIRGLLYLDLSHNRLRGGIPRQLENLHRLISLLLNSNLLAGEIPAEIGNLSNLVYLCLDSNELEGGIPPSTGNLDNLRLLQLQDNRLRDALPMELGRLSGLHYLYLNSNKIWEAIPGSLKNLTQLMDLDVGFNALYTYNQQLKGFLDSNDPDWAATQTAAPTGLTAYPLSNTAVLLTWTPISYTGDTGFYKAYASLKPGDYSAAGNGTSEDKRISQLTVTGLKRNTTYYFVTKTRTEPHEFNKNTVISQIGKEVSAKTKNANTVKISGTIKDTEGRRVPGVVLTFSNFGGHCQCGGSGYYSHQVVSGWSGIVKPAKNGYFFSPASRTYSNTGAARGGQDYTAIYGMIHEFSVQRKQESAWFIKRDYADIQLTVKYPGYADRFIIYRKEQGKSQELIHEFFPADLREGHYSYSDTFIETHTSYTYILAALNSAKTVIAVSTEQTIQGCNATHVASGGPPGGRTFEKVRSKLLF